MFYESGTHRVTEPAGESSEWSLNGGEPLQIKIHNLAMVEGKFIDFCALVFTNRIEGFDFNQTSSVQSNLKLGKMNKVPSSAFDNELTDKLR